LPLKTLTSNNF